MFFNSCKTFYLRYNAPTASQVAAIWTDGNDPQRCFDRSVIVYPRGEKMRYIKAYHGCYDPLAYPLFHPRGETGWNQFMPYNDSPTVERSVPEPTGMPTQNQLSMGVLHVDAILLYNILIIMYSHLNAEDGESDNDIQQGDHISRVVETGQSTRFVTAREYYCFMMQVRKGLFNILLFGGRLFQQWAVDMYIKIESMRLDWYSNPENQKLIRAELYQVSRI